jgi:hypothetical protein
MASATTIAWVVIITVHVIVVTITMAYNALTGSGNQLRITEVVIMAEHLVV